MTEVISPIARALLGDSDEPDREITCCVCNAKTTCPGFIVASIRLWNAEHPEEQPIRPSEMGVTCEGACTTTMFRRRHDEQQRDNATTLAYLAMLHVGKYNPESLAWLRKNGLGRYVTRLLHEEGTKSHG